jgi:hypothetical protein
MHDQEIKHNGRQVSRYIRNNLYISAIWSGIFTLNGRIAVVIHRVLAGTGLDGSYPHNEIVVEANEVERSTDLFRLLRRAGNRAPTLLLITGG